ncbi:MAG: NADH-quinone oxidoreductase subunit NuoF [Anaerolineae bacterium]|jgi:NADH:ubiquinone oxidoreductase subunit F (NADH-binding)/(2Fe-2S) ferredoxin
MIIEKQVVTICRGPGCETQRADKLQAMMEAEIARQGLPIEVKRIGCHGLCEQGPIVTLEPQGIAYFKVQPKDIEDIVESLANAQVVKRLLYRDPATKKRVEHYRDIPFYAKQMRVVVLKQNGRIDPESIDDYVSAGGYQSLRRVLTGMTPEEVVNEIKNSGLRGRGGAGFLTGLKWEFTRKAPGEIKYIIANGDEGDPGAFMDRVIMEGNPHSVLEGMAIGAYAIGANEGYIYVRDEYPQAVKRLRLAIQQAEEHGFLGDNILDTGFGLKVKIVRGAGAFVCGESSALMASVEGRVGEPRPKHVHATHKGLWDRPTALNNVETWANVPVIIENGGDWYAEIGTARSSGTKAFSLVGKVKNTGLIEVPMGTTLREIIYDIGGGLLKNREFKAIQTGGPSGGCIPANLLDLPVDYEQLADAGSMMGSGGMIVMDERTCMVDVARYFVDFLRDESCGKCAACREGIRQMLSILTDITQGRGEEGDIELLEELGKVVQQTSMCGLGKSAPNPVLSTIRHFRHEYEAHIRDKKCPAGVCRELTTFYIDPELCKGCTICKQRCPVDAISGEVKAVHAIDDELCIRCGVCREACPSDAVVAL